MGCLWSIVWGMWIGKESMNSWHNYPSIYNLGHKAVADLFTVPVNVEEKVDGSQFSFGVSEEGEIKIRSKGCVMLIDAPEKMFTKAANTVRDLASVLHPGWTYRGEFLAKPKHNALIYSRVPTRHIIIFDINTSEETYLGYKEKVSEASRIGLECVALLASGMIGSAEELRDLLERESVLGGQKIEGMVIKPSAYDLFGPDKKVLMGKFVSESFKEVHAAEWRKSNPTPQDIIEQIALDMKTPARWNKAIQHLAEAGQLEGSPRDIGALMKEVPADIEKECSDEIKDRLFRFAWPHIRRKVTAGLPEWYKEQLLSQQFEHKELL